MTCFLPWPGFLTTTAEKLVQMTCRNEGRRGCVLLHFVDRDIHQEEMQSRRLTASEWCLFIHLPE